MKEEHITQLKLLKEKFKKLTPKERENIGVCFLKLKLGVHNPQEFDVVMGFLGEFKMDINPENLDGMINYLHAQDHSLPEFLALEDSITEVDKIKPMGLSEYSALEADTLKEIEITKKG